MLRGAFAQNRTSGIAIDRTLGRLRQQLAQTTDPQARTALNNTIFNTEQQRWTTDAENPEIGRREGEIIPLRIVQGKLAPYEAVLEYVAGEQRFYCLIITAKSARIVALGNRVGVEEQIDSYLADIADIKGKTSSGHALYSMLLEPIAELGAARHLTLIRDGRLNLLPWDALVGNSNRYLVEVDNISFSLSVSSAILLRAKRPIVTAKAMLAVGGIPYEESDLLVAPSWQN
jgi:hypothetical protein